MAVKADFSADTSSFVKEVKKADDALEQFGGATKTAQTQAAGFGEAMNVASGVLGAFGVSLSIGAVVNFGKEILADADALVTLAAKTGLSIEALQTFQIVGDDTSVTVDQIAGAVVQLENRIASGDKSAIAALDALGLSFQAFKRLTPENQFIALADAIGRVDDPAQQVKLALDLMGKKGAEVLPLLKEGFQGVADGAGVMSADTVRALDDVGDALGRAARVAKGEAAEAFRFLFLGWGQAARDVDALAASLKDATAAAHAGAPAFGALVPPGLPTDLEEIYKHLDADAKAIKAADDALKPFTAAMGELSLAGTGWVAVLETIDGKVVEAIKYYLDAGVSQKALADAYGLTATQIAAVDAARKNELAGLSFEESAKKRLLEIQGLMLKATNDQVLKTFEARQAAEALIQTELDAALKAEEWWSKAETGTQKATAATHEATKAAGVYMNQLHMLVNDPTLAAFFGSGPQGAVATTLYSGGQAGITPEMAAAMAAGQFINTAGVGAVHINISHPLGTPQAIAHAVSAALTPGIMQGRKLSGS